MRSKSACTTLTMLRALRSVLLAASVMLSTMFLGGCDPTAPQSDAQAVAAAMALRPAKECDYSKIGLSSDAAPTCLNMYVKVNDIWNLNLKDGSFHADLFYYVIGSKTKIERLSLVFVNGTVEQASGVGASQTIRPEKEGDRDIYVITAQDGVFNTLPDGQTIYANAASEVVFRSDFDISRYPLDTQRLKIVIESNVEPTDSVRFFVIDGQSSFFNPPHLPGWVVSREIECDVTEQSYEYLWDDATKSMTGEDYSRVTCAIDLHREDRIRLLIKSSLTLLISLSILIIGFMLPSSDVATRVSVGVASVFGVVTSQLVVQSGLPEIPTFSLIEKIHVLSLFIVLVVCTVYIISFSLSRDRPPELVRRFETISLLVVSVGMVSTTTLLILGLL